MRGPITRLIGLVGLIPLIAACSPFMPCRAQPQPPDPVVATHISRMRLVDPSRLEFAVDLEIENPGRAFKITRANYQVFASDRLLASIHTVLDVDVPAQGTASATLASSFTYLNLPRRTQSEFAREEAVVFAVRGRLFTSPAIAPLPFDDATSDVSFDDSDEPPWN